MIRWAHGTWMLASRALAAVALVACLSAAAPAVAQDAATDLQWDARWHRADFTDYLLIGALTWAGLTAEFALIPDLARWRGGILMDDWIHENLSLRDPIAREVADTVSDILQWVALSWPIAVDTILIPWVIERNADVGWQLFTINSISVASTLALSFFIKNLIARERPFARNCRVDPQWDFECEQPERNRSFYSGHTAFAVTAAGLICMHHDRLPLYGGVRDRIACYSAIGVATTVGLLRILADKHYFTDVFVGAVAGIVSGVLLPWFLRYGFDDRPFE